MRNAEWETEAILANPSFGMAVVATSASVAAFVGLSWMFEVVFGWEWPQILLALGVVVFLVQGLPTDVREEFAGQSRLVFTVPLWIARTAFLFVYFGVYFSFMDLGSPSRWILLLLMSIVVGPLMWFALLQVRQAGLLGLIGPMSPHRVGVVALVAVSQVAFWGAVLGAWFGAPGLGVAMLVTLVASAWHVGGNVIIFKQFSGERRVVPAGKDDHVL